MNLVTWCTDMIKFYIYEKLKKVYLQSTSKSCKIHDQAVSYIVSYRSSNKTKSIFTVYSLSYYLTTDNIHNSSLSLRQNFYCDYRIDRSDVVADYIHPVSLKLILYEHSRLLDYLFIFSISKNYPNLMPITLEDLFEEMKIFASGV